MVRWLRSNAWTRKAMSRACSTIRRACSTAIRPHSLSSIRFFCRVNRVTCSSASSRCMERLSADWERCSCSAAWDRVPHSDTASSCSN